MLNAITSHQKTGEPVRLNMYDYAMRVTLDVVGSGGEWNQICLTAHIDDGPDMSVAFRIGFGYEMNSIEHGVESKYAEAFGALFSGIRSIRPVHVMLILFPVLRSFVVSSQIALLTSAPHAQLSCCGGFLIARSGV